MQVLIPRDQFDPRLRSINLDILKIPRTKIDRIYQGKREVTTDYYSLSSSRILLHKNFHIDDEDFFVYISTNAQFINLAIWIPVIVAIIGVLGNIIPFLYDKIETLDPLEAKIIVEPDRYGVNTQNNHFEAVIQWDTPSEKTYVFDRNIVDDFRGWVFLRIRRDQTDIMEAIVADPKGPYPLRNGMLFSVPIQNSILSEWKKGEAYIQLVLVALPASDRLEHGRKLSYYRKEMKLLLTPAYRSTR